MKRPEHKRIDTGPGTSLEHQPFANLSGGAPPPPERVEAPKPAAVPKAAYKIVKTRKGNWPLQVERRAGGKFVTVIGNVEGDASALLKDLRKFCGAGGVLREGSIEIQGDQSEKVKRFLESL